MTTDFLPYLHHGFPHDLSVQGKISRYYVANVLGGRYRFTDKLVRACAEHLGIDFGYVGMGAEDSERMPAGVA
jgi:hypothetical protein